MNIVEVIFNQVAYIGNDVYLVVFTEKMPYELLASPKFFYTDRLSKRWSIVDITYLTEIQKIVCVLQSSNSTINKNTSLDSVISTMRDRFPECKIKLKGE